MNNNDKLQNLLQLLDKLGLVQTLQEMSQVTIFAPSDDAFANVNLEDLKEKDLKRHLIGVKIASKQIKTGPAFTLSGDVVNIIKNEQGQIQVEHNGKVVNVVKADVLASNGVIHVVDQLVV